MVKRKTEDIGHPDYNLDSSEYPANAIPLISLDSLPNLENNMVGSIKLDINRSQWGEWACRTPLEKLIRPTGLYGEIVDPYMIMMDQPYDEMIDALGDPAKSFVQGHVLYERSLENPRFLESAKKCIGFQLLGQIKKQDHPISAQVWYINAPTRTTGSPASLRSHEDGGIIRIISTPAEQRESIQQAIRQRKLSTAALGTYVAKPNGGRTSRKSTLR